MTRAQSDLTDGRGGRRGGFATALAAWSLSLSLCATAALAQTSLQPPLQIKDEAPLAAPAPIESDRELKTEAFGAEAAKPSPTAEAFQPSDLPHDLSPWGMFRNANTIVKLVMVGLAVASVVTWTIWLAKSLELWSAKRAARRGLEALSNAPSLRGAEKALAPSRAPIALLVAAALGEADRSAGLASDGVKERAVALLSRIEAQAGRAMNLGTGALATIGSTAPFVGLFGTVWGIMDSFIGISKTHTTNLAVVAPGIAEALLATAMGLVAAIPAVVIYNMFARSIAGYRALLSDAAAEVLRHLSRDLDRETAPGRGDDMVIPMRQSAE